MTEKRYRIVSETPESFQEFEEAIDRVSNTISEINGFENKYPNDFDTWIAELPENLKNLYDSIVSAQQGLMTNKISNEEREEKRSAFYIMIATNPEKNAELAELWQILKQKDLEKSRERHDQS